MAPTLLIILSFSKDFILDYTPLKHVHLLCYTQFTLYLYINMRLVIATLTFILPFVTLIAQIDSEPYGTINPVDLAMNFCPYDSSANAMVLQEVGTRSITIDENSKPVNYLVLHKRVKIFNKDAFEEGNITIFYHKDDDLRHIRGIVYGQDGSKTELKPEHIFTEKVNDRWYTKKIFIPNIQVGCIFDLWYEKESFDVVAPDDWLFQSEIPVRLSNYKLEYPEVYNYIAIRFFGVTPAYEKAHITNHDARGFGSSKLVRHEVTFQNMPAVKKEPFVTNIEDHMSKVGHQLKSYEASNGLVIPVFSDWDLLAKELNEDLRFGKQINHARNYKDILKAYDTAHPTPFATPQATAQSILVFLAKEIKWNEYFSLMPSESNLNEVFEKKSGNSADLNLAMIAILREKGLKANPVLISTRKHGAYIPGYPIVSQFNSVIVGLEDNGKILFYDATSPYNYANVINTEHSNYFGWVATKGNPNWIPVTPAIFSETIFFEGELKPDLSLEGNIGLRLGGTAGVTIREMFAKQPNANFLAKRYKGVFEEAEISKVETEMTDLGKAANVKYHVVFQNSVQKVGEMIYVPLMVEKFYNENPFKSPTRDYPVQLPYSIKEEYIINLTIPDGYTIEDIPEATKLVIEGGPQFIITSTRQSERQVQVRMTLQVMEQIYPTETYDGLRNFMNGVIEKQDLQIVLKKV
jgi:Domain of Unknown Function with PDB structure (DUF3857)/Domain of Unknown Function with PDB structure (DUF3858)